MPRNPNGEYVLPSIYLAASGQTIRADQHNIPMQDIAQALTGSMARNGSTPMTGNLPMNSNRITGLAAATASSDAVRLDQVTKYSGYLNAVSGLALAANEITYATGPASAARTALTPFGRGLIAAADAAAGRTSLALGAVATDNVVPVSRGGTGGTTQAAGRAGLGLGNVATDDVVPVSRGGTGATNAAGARTGLGLGNLATQNTLDINGSFLTGTLSVAGGGTGANNAGSARNNLGLGAVATDNVVPVTRGGTGATDASGARSAIGAPWSPAGGAIIYGQSPVGAAVVLPAGGTWEWFALEMSSVGGTIAAGIVGGIAAGGSTVAGPLANRIYQYRFWRVTQ